jgi:hypothetical protein
MHVADRRQEGNDPAVELPDRNLDVDHILPRQALHRRRTHVVDPSCQVTKLLCNEQAIVANSFGQRSRYGRISTIRELNPPSTRFSGRAPR